MDTEREPQHRRLTEPHRSKAAKLAWKRHHSSYMRANRKKERDNMNKSFYSISKELEESIKQLEEAKVEKEDIFDFNCQIVLSNMSGGISFAINKETGEVSLSTALLEDGRGNYRIQNFKDAGSLEGLYEELKDDIEQLANTIDQSLTQIIAKHGLRQA